jgi:hypothetical protein
LAQSQTRHLATTSRRLTRREIARQRVRRERFAFAGLLSATVVVAAALIIILPPLLAPGGSAPPPSGGNPAIISNTPMHIHVGLALFNGTQQATIPEDIGRNPARWVDHSLDQYLDLREGTSGSLAPIHTHDTSGTVHVEASVTMNFTLGQFFSIWGQPFGPNQVVNLMRDPTHTLTMTVNGIPDEEWGALVLVDQQQIEVHYDAI